MRSLYVPIIFLVFPLISFSQTTWYVPDDFPAGIQAAILDSSVVSGDTLIVRSGTYLESISFMGKNITVRSEEGPALTVIDGQQTWSVADFTQGETADAVLSGFTLTNGYTDSYFGGGIFCRDSSPIIENNIITGNTASNGSGGGIYCDNGSPLIRNNMITWNGTDEYGGGIECMNASPTITGNLISHNTAKLSGGGIGVFNSSPLVVNNMICHNSADLAGGIGGGKSTSFLVNNTITENTANRGGGLYAHYLSVITAENTILWNNTAATGPEAHLGMGSTLTISHSNVQGGQASIFVDAGCTLNWGTGMLDSNPGFVDPANEDYHLRHTSPCRNEGNNGVVNLPDEDFEDDPRIAQGAVDMGADEFHLHFYITESTTPSSLVEAKFVGLPGSLINGLILGINIFDPPLPCDYGLWYVDHPMQVITGLGLIPAEGVSIFSSALPAAPPGPYTVYLQAAIDYELTNLYTLHVQP